MEEGIEKIAKGIENTVDFSQGNVESFVT